MACAVSTISGVKANTFGALKESTRLITFTSYDTSGCAVTPSQYGMFRFVRASTVVLTAGFASGYAHVDPLVQTDGTMLVRLRAAAGTESSSGAGSAAVTARVTMIGY